MQISELIGKTFTSVTGYQGGDTLTFEGDQGSYEFYHVQDCCESVQIEDINGSLSDLVGSPILQADEETGETPVAYEKDIFESCTWTFYRFATAKGYVVVRWLGTSNGYYSESVDFRKI